MVPEDTSEEGWGERKKVGFSLWLIQTIFPKLNLTMRTVLLMVLKSIHLFLVA